MSLEIRVPKELFTEIFDASEMRSFAILDPAMWEQTGGELLADLNASGLKHKSLYIGDAVAQHEDSAPLLVLLDANESAAIPFINSLLGSGWSRHSGILLQSNTEFDVLHRACRKLIRVADTDGSWYFNRYWEPEFFLYMSLFMYDCRLYHQLNEVSRFFVSLADEIVSITPDFSEAPAIVNQEEQVDLLFEAGAAMVAYRRLRERAAEAETSFDSDELYDYWYKCFGDFSFDYSILEHSVDVIVALHTLYPGNVMRYLNAEVLEKCRDLETNRQSDMFQLLHGTCRFAELNKVRPDQLWVKSGVRFGSISRTNRRQCSKRLECLPHGHCGQSLIAKRQ